MPEIGRPEFREIIFRNSYRVIDRIESKRVAILTVRNIAQRLDGDEISARD